MGHNVAALTVLLVCFTTANANYFSRRYKTPKKLGNGNWVDQDYPDNSGYRWCADSETYSPSGVLSLFASDIKDNETQGE